MPDDRATEFKDLDCPAVNSNDTDQFTRVLIVDDDPQIVTLIKKFLTSIGFTVEVARNGHDALEFVQENPPNFLITDLDMPSMSGTELCSRMRELDIPNYIYTIMLTATSPHRLIDGLESGADDFICKPIRMSELAARIKAGARLISMESRLRFLASHDALTGLFNRRNFFEQFAALFKRSVREGKPFSCLMMDIDRFKAINDRYGHLAGDQVLRQASAALEKAIPNDLMGRYGGEEFAVAFFDCDESSAVERAEAARVLIENTPIQIESTTIRISASFGVATLDKDVRTEVNLIDRADQALFNAKDQGRNRVVAYTENKFVQLPTSNEEEVVFDTRR